MTLIKEIYAKLILKSIAYTLQKIGICEKCSGDTFWIPTTQTGLIFYIDQLQQSHSESANQYLTKVMSNKTNVQIPVHIKNIAICSFKNLKLNDKLTKC